VSTAKAQDLDSIRSNGLHESCLVFADPEALKKPSMANRNLEPNTDLTFTLDIPHLENAEQTIRIISGYQDTTLTLTDQPLTFHLPSNVSFLEFEEAYRKDSSVPYLRIAKKSSNGTHRTKIGSRSISNLHMLATQFDVPIERIELAEAHHELGQNYLVSDDPDIRKLKNLYCRDRKHHFIKSSELIETLTRLERRRGIYYTSPSNTINKGMYYWRELLRQVPEFDKLWATAVYGVQDPVGGLPSELFEFAQSLGDRVMGLLELHDELEILTENSPHNDAEWDIVNRLNYFFVLVTGLLDNLAWIALARYGLISQYHQPGKWNNVSLQMRDKNGAIAKKPFNLTISNMSQQLYDHIYNHQDLISVFYPTRDSIQHRLVLSGSRVEYLDHDWATIMVSFHPDTLAALEVLEPAKPYDLNTWGLFHFEHLRFVGPEAFSRTALSHLLAFTRKTLEILDMPAMLAGQPTLKAKVDQESPQTKDLLAR